MLYLVERREQLTLLERAASASFSGKGKVILIEGTIASGKTALLQSFSERLAQAGALVLSAGCAEAERSLACGVISQLLHSASLPAEAADRLRRPLATAPPVVAGASAPGGPDPELLRLFNDLCVGLLELAAERPVLIAVDDVQYADGPSLEFLRQLIRRLRSASILVVLTGEADPNQRHAPFRAELHRQLHFHRVTVAPLSQGGLTDLLARCLPEKDAQRLAPAFLAATGGNPLLVHALAEDCQAAGGGDAVPAEAPEYGLAFLGCLRRGEPPLLDVARALAVLDGEGTAADVARLLETGVDAVHQALRRMTAAGLLDAGAFRHPAARVAVLRELPADLRAELHCRAARALHDRDAPAPVVARHLRQAGQAPPDWATPVLLEAAEHALAGGEQETAAAYLELALDAATGPRDAAAIRARLVQIEWWLDPARAARHLAALTAAMRTGTLERRDGIALVRWLLWHGRGGEAASVLEQLRSGGEEGDDGERAAAAAELRAVEQWLAFTHPPAARRRPASAAPADRRAAVVAPLVDTWLQATARLAELQVRGQGEDAVEQAVRVLRDLLLGQPTGWAVEAASIALELLARADRIDVAADWCERLAGMAGVGQAPTWQAVIAAARSEVAMAEGDLVGAREHARAALERAAPKAWGVAVGLPLANLILADARLGRLDEATALLAQPLPEAMFHSRYGLRFLYARGHYHLAIRHHHAALADFLSCGELARRWGLDLAGLVPWRASAAEAWLRLGNKDQARRLINDQLARPGSNGARARALSLRLLAAAGPPGRRPQLLTESLELFESCGDRYEQARTLADLSSAYHALDENRRARMVFRRALHLAKACQAEVLYRELLSLDDLGEELATEANADRLSKLTRSEWRVAALAAVGYTNREIASKLYITLSTVEQHLTRIYRKLNIEHRGQIPIDVCRRGEWRLRGAR